MDAPKENIFFYVTCDKKKKKGAEADSLFRWYSFPTIQRFLNKEGINFQVCYEPRFMQHM